ncbi:unnamed protein product [Clonostachys solani]|uniref:Uncharacterized protein n=1 Tax=Clonostachys solani TaxID=160281 RepID=A0A9P0EP50_9HYPO|nr:unnamed protein product [Clonostachys solani]
MALLCQHVTNLSSNTPPIVFKNDDNNVSALENARLQKKRMEEAARLQKKQLEEAAERLQKQAEDTEEVVRERDHLRSKSERLTQENAAAMGLLDAMKRQKDEEIAALSSRDAQRAAEMTRLNQLIFSGRVPNMARQDNCLPLVYHNATVHIVNAFCPLGLDSGYQKVYFPTNALGLDVHVGNALGKQCYWYIGRGSNNRVGSWVIKSAEWGTCIGMGNGGKENARRVYSYQAGDHVDANWLMVPLSFN